MKRKKIMPLLAMCLILVITFMTTANAEEGYTTVGGENKSQMTVTGNLSPRQTEPTEESEEEFEKETPKPVVKPNDIASDKKDGFLPKTGENQSKYHVFGLFLVIGSLLIINKNRLKRKI